MFPYTTSKKISPILQLIFHNCISISFCLLFYILIIPLGLENTNRGCCGTGLVEVIYLCNKLSRTCPDDSKFLFWDSIHLSEIGCNIFANQSLPGLVGSLF